MRKGTVQSTSELQCGSSLFSEGDFWLVAHRLTNLKASRNQLAHQTLEPILCCTVHTPVSISSVEWSSMDLFGERLQRTFLLWIWSSKSQNSVFYEVSRWDMDFAWPAREVFRDTDSDTIPLGLVYYYKKAKKITWKGGVIAFLVGLLVILVFKAWPFK